MRTAKAWVTMGDNPRVDDVSGLVPIAPGWAAKVSDEGGLVTLRVASTESSPSTLTGVRSVSPPTASAPEVTVWTSDDDEFVSPAFAHGAEFRIEVSTAEHPKPAPVGGGHFRVVEEGGG